MDDGLGLPKRAPVDVKIVACLGFLSALIEFGVLLLIVTGAAHAPAEAPGRVLLNTVTLSTDFSIGLCSSVRVVAYVLGAYGLLRLRWWAWWLVLGTTALGTADGALGMDTYPVAGGLGTLFGAAILIWLIVRRRLFL